MLFDRADSMASVGKCSGCIYAIHKIVSTIDKCDRSMGAASRVMSTRLISSLRSLFAKHWQMCRTNAPKSGSILSSHKRKADINFYSGAQDRAKLKELE